MFLPGLMRPSAAGPTLEKYEISSRTFVDPIPMTLLMSPGELAVPQDGPENLKPINVIILVHKHRYV